MWEWVFKLELTKSCSLRKLVEWKLGSYDVESSYYKVHK